MIEVPFTASPSDIEPHGREIFTRCRSGEFGPIENFCASSLQKSTNGVTEAEAPLDWQKINNFIEHANAENTSGTIRGIILVWSSMIESLLGDLLEIYLTEQKFSTQPTQIDAREPPKSFSRRSKICREYGLISKRDLTICNHMWKIRNLAAHEWDVSLKSSKFAKTAIPSLQALYNTDHSESHVWDQSDLRRMIQLYYAGSCGLLAMRLSHRISEVKADRRTELPNPNKFGATDT